MSITCCKTEKKLCDQLQFNDVVVKIL